MVKSSYYQGYKVSHYSLTWVVLKIMCIDKGLKYTPMGCCHQENVTYFSHCFYSTHFITLDKLNQLGNAWLSKLCEINYISKHALLYYGKWITSLMNTLLYWIIWITSLMNTLYWIIWTTSLVNTLLYWIK